MGVRLPPPAPLDHDVPLGQFHLRLTPRTDNLFPCVSLPDPCCPPLAGPDPDRFLTYNLDRFKGGRSLPPSLNAMPFQPFSYQLAFLDHPMTNRQAISVAVPR
jgi:hypothetical protein